MNNLEPKKVFHADFYLEHNSKRLEHLESLKLPIKKDMSVFETGAGIGDHTKFFINKGCVVTPSEGRTENWLILKEKYTNAILLDLENPEKSLEPVNKKYDIIYCYGTLYHLGTPLKSINYMSEKCEKFLLLETCVSLGEQESIGLCREAVVDPTQSVSGIACRPTRSWIFNRLKKKFKYVYMPITQPDHNQFIEDWSSANSDDPNQLFRSIFIGSNIKIDNELLVEEIPYHQEKYKK